MNAPFVGLTGNIGSGKSTVSARWALHGAKVLDADGISRALLQTDGGCYGAVTAAFPGVRLPDGAIDRRALARIVFSDEAARLTLNGIVHPAVCRAMLDEGARIRRTQPGAPVIFDVPLLFECGLDRQMDRNVFVYADDAVRLMRILARDGCDEAQALSRMRSQGSQTEKMARCGSVIDNSGDLAALYRQADDLYESFVAML